MSHLMSLCVCVCVCVCVCCSWPGCLFDTHMKHGYWAIRPGPDICDVLRVSETTVASRSKRSYAPRHTHTHTHTRAFCRSYTCSSTCQLADCNPMD